MGQFDQEHAGLWLGDDFQRQTAFQRANQVMAETGPQHNDGLAAGDQGLSHGKPETGDTAEKNRYLYRGYPFPGGGGGLGVDPMKAVESTWLADFHRDPADQIISATSRILGLPLMTADRRLLGYSGIEALR